MAGKNLAGGMLSKEKMETQDDVVDAFRAALRYFEKKHGRGFQARLSKLTGIPRSSLNDMMTGDYCSTEKRRRQIASALGHSYEEFLDLGRKLLGLPSFRLIEKFPYYLEAQAYPPNSEERATFIYQKAGEAVGFDSVMFFNEDAIRAESEKLPGWNDYLSGKIDDFQLYRIALEEMENRLNVIREALKKRGPAFRK